MSDLIKTFRYLYQDQKSLGKCWQLFRRHFNQYNLESTRYLWKKFQNLANLEQWKKRENKTIQILATPHTCFIAELIVNALKKTDLHFKITIKETEIKYNDDDLYIVICPQYYKKLPKTYIAFQLEQTVSDRWFTQKQMVKLKNSLLVVDYSLHNIEYLTSKLPFSQLYYLPISPIQLDRESHREYEYDVLFYGDTNNQRRQEYIKELSKHFKIKIVNNAFGNEIWHEIRKSKIVVNIHYYEDALLETTRLYECLSNHAFVISEKSADFNQHTDLINLIDFVDVGDINQMITRISYYLNNINEFEQAKSRISKYIQQQHSPFNYYFYRVLLSLDLISFDFFYENTHKLWQPQSNFWSLGLPESIERKQEFCKELEKYSEIWCFPGIRHTKPWIGCGMSYKYIIRYAKDNKLPNITICEDDVLLPQGFKEKFEDINQFLDKRTHQWDIFSGHVTDLDDSSAIEPIDKDSNFTYIALTKTTGMLFN
ncbi:glycosyltransferase family 25 protein, partial [Acinetobacter gerneri]